MGKSSSSVKNSTHFVGKITNVLIHSNQMVNLDEVSLFTRVTTDETLTVVQEKMATGPSLEEHICIPIDNAMALLYGNDLLQDRGLANTDKKKDWLGDHHCP